MWMLSPPSGVFQYTKKLFLSEQTGRAQALEFVRKNAANAISMANLIMGLSSILCNLNGLSYAFNWFGQDHVVPDKVLIFPHYFFLLSSMILFWLYYCACWLLLIGFLLDLADGAVARQLNACSALGAKLDDFADFTSFGLATALLLQAHGILDGLLSITYVLAVFARLCFFSSGIPFMYRGLPCPYASSLLTGTYILTGGNLVLLRMIALVMILFMVDQGFYPHDKVLESQPWKKVVYAGGILMVLFSSYSIASLYYLIWSSSYIFFPVALWSSKV